LPLLLFYRPSFARSLKLLGPDQKKIVGSILETLQVYYSSNCNLEKAKNMTPGFFYKQLRRPYFETGIEKSLRIVIRREKDKCIAILIGNHDQIRQFLSNV